MSVFLLLIQSAFAERFMPYQGTAIAAEIDYLYSFLLIVSLIAFVILIGGMLYFALKYRRKADNEPTPRITHNTALEFLWSGIPFIIFMIAFAWGLIIHKKMVDFPDKAFEVHVTGYRWAWDFQYKSGKKITNELYVPAGEPVKLIMTSKDVIHSFFIPAFRVKQDVVPGRYTALWFEAKTPGVYQVFCTEYCGTNHSRMLAKLHVLPKKKFEKWLSDNPYKGLSLAQRGEKILKGSCAACHGLSNARKIGPGFQGLWGKERVLEDGTTVVADAEYIRNSILYPQKQIVKSYNQVKMNSYQGQLSEDELTYIIEYFKNEKGN